MNRARINPLKRLVLELRCAAHRIDDPRARAIAAREADLIPLTLIEQRRSRKGDIARLGRTIMKRLPELEGQALIEAETVLRGCADAIDSEFNVTDEIWLGRKRRSDSFAA